MEFENASMKILIVDDNEIDLELLEAILKHIGFQNIIKSERSIEAMRLAREHQPDLFIIDIIMPEMTGGELRERLRDNSTTRGIPVIFISGIISREEEKKLGGRLASGDLIIAKPLSRDKIAAAIDSVLTKSSKL